MTRDPRRSRRFLKSFAAVLAVSSLCSFQDRPKLELSPELLPAQGKPYREVRRVDKAGKYTVVHKKELEWDKGGDRNGDGKDDRTSVVGEDTKGNKIVCVMLQKSSAVTSQYIAYGLLKPGGGIVWFGRCGYDDAANGTHCEGKDGDGDGAPDVETEGPMKGMVEEYSKVSHDNLDAKKDETGELEGTDDRHYCHFLDGPNAGMNQTRKTKGEWKKQKDCSYKYETEDELTVECPPTVPPDDPGGVGSESGGGIGATGGSGGGGLTGRLGGTVPYMLHAASYALDGFPIDAAGTTWSYQMAINPPLGIPGETAVGDTGGPDGTYRFHEFSIRAGDKLYLSGYGLSNARVVAPATSLEFGSWSVSESTPDYIVFEAASDVLLRDLPILPVPNGYTYIIDGFLVDSSYPVGSSPAHLMGAEFGDYRLAPAPSPWLDLGESSRGAGYWEPRLVADGDIALGSSVTLQLLQGPSGTSLWLVLGLARGDQALLGGTLVPQIDALIPLTTDALGHASYSLPIPDGTPPGTLVFAQVLVPDAGFTEAAFSNALQLTVLP